MTLFLGKKFPKWPKFASKGMKDTFALLSYNKMKKLWRFAFIMKKKNIQSNYCKIEMDMKDWNGFIWENGN